MLEIELCIGNHNIQPTHLLHLSNHNFLRLLEVAVISIFFHTCEVSLVSCFSSKGRSATCVVASHVDAMPWVCDIARIGGWRLWDMGQAQGLVETLRINASGNRPFSIEKVCWGEGRREVFVTKPFLNKSLQGGTICSTKLHELVLGSAVLLGTGSAVKCTQKTWIQLIDFVLVNQYLRLPGVSSLFFLPFVGQSVLLCQHR